jgi:uncharacterized protein (DUF1330 family)
MKGYIIVDVKITNPVGYDDYRKHTQSTLEAYGGKFIVRGGKAELLEGDWDPGRIVILEFPSVEKAKAWWSSAPYEKIKGIRQANSVTQMIVVEGYEIG